eukprot:jgi/Mesvir1/11572/Mv04334-RA.1
MMSLTDLPPELIDKILSSVSVEDASNARVCTYLNNVYKDYFTGVHFLQQIGLDPRMTIPNDGVLGITGEAVRAMRQCMPFVARCMTKVDNNYYAVFGVVAHAHLAWLVRCVNHLFPAAPGGDRVTIGTLHDLYSIPASLNDCAHESANEVSKTGLRTIRSVLLSGMVTQPRNRRGYADGYRRYAYMEVRFGIYARVIFCLDSSTRLWCFNAVDTWGYHLGLLDVTATVDTDDRVFVTSGWNNVFDDAMADFVADPAGTLPRWARRRECVFCRRTITNLYDMMAGIGSGCRRRYKHGLLQAGIGDRGRPLVEITI